MELGSHQGNDHLAYWIFAPILFIFVYLSRPYSWYRFSWIVPLVALAIIGMTNDSSAFLFSQARISGGANFYCVTGVIRLPI